MQADSLLRFDSVVDPDEYLYADGVYGAHWSPSRDCQAIQLLQLIWSNSAGLSGLLGQRIQTGPLHVWLHPPHPLHMDGP